MAEFKTRKFVDRVGVIRTRLPDGRLRYDYPDGTTAYSAFLLWTDEHLKQIEERKDTKEVDP